MTVHPRPRKRILILFLLGGLVAVVGTLAWFPMMRTPPAQPASPPVPTYAEAVAAIRHIIAETPSSVGPPGHPILLEHGHPTEQVFVLLHGLSNAPAQFEKLGRILFERGHTVYIPRLPYHGESDRMTTDWQRLTAQDMVDFGNTAADLARGLGRKVTVAGLSINGTTVAWMAQNRSDLHRCVLMAPFFAPARAPKWTIGPTIRLTLRLPNVFLWWDPVKKQDHPGPPYAYPRFPTRVIGQTMWLGQLTLDAARKSAPAAPRILVITTAADVAVENAVTDDLVTAWRRHRPAGLDAFEFPASEKVPHDFIDPTQPNQQTDLVYPQIIEWLEAE